MENNRIVIYQERTVSYTSRFTWGEGYEEREHIHYGSMGIYIEQPILPTRLLGDLKEVKQLFLDKKSGFYDEDGNCYKVIRGLRRLFNQEKISIINTHDEKDIEGLIEIDSIKISEIEKSIFTYICIQGIYDSYVNTGAVSYALNSINKYDENLILNLLGLRFDESYLSIINSEHAHELLKMVMQYALETILNSQSYKIVSKTQSFIIETIRQNLYACMSTPPESSKYLSEETITGCINYSIRYCADLFMRKTISEILTKTEDDKIQDAFSLLSSCRQVSNNFNLYIDQAVKEILLRKVQYILNSEDKWNHDTIYASLKSCLPLQYQNEDIVKRRAISCAHDLLEKHISQILELDKYYDYQAEYKYMRALFPDIIENTLTCQLNAQIEKCVSDLLHKKVKALIEKRENIDYQAAYNSLRVCVPDDTSLFGQSQTEKSHQQYKFHAYIQLCCDIFMKNKIDDILNSNTYLQHDAVIAALEPCLPTFDKSIDLTFLLKRYSATYVNRWLELNNYIVKLRYKVIERENFRTEQEYKEFTLRYLKDAPERFDDIIINTIIGKIFTNFKMPAKFVKIEVERLAGPKIIGKIDLDKIRKK